MTMTDTGTQEGQQGHEGSQEGAGGQEGSQGGEGGEQTFDARYVAGLREEAARYRQRAHDAEQRAESVLEALWQARRAEATRGLLADATDLAGDVAMLDDDGLPDVERIRAAAEELVKAKPHLGERRPTGSIEQGARGGEQQGVNLANRLRSLAG
jgi:hypothetical protein